MGEFGMVGQLDVVIISSLGYAYGGVLGGIGVRKWGERKKRRGARGSWWGGYVKSWKVKSRNPEG